MPLQMTVHRDLPYLVIDVSGTAQLPDYRGVVALES
jgi:hypothetical protein